jgi:hypothetical protein
MEYRFTLMAGIVLIAEQSCGRHDAASGERLGAAPNAVIIDDQRTNTFPTGAIFSPNGLRYVAYAGADSDHQVNIVSSPAPASGTLASWSVLQIVRVYRRSTSITRSLSAPSFD